MLDAHPDWLRANEFHHSMSLYYVRHYLNGNKRMHVLDYGCGMGRLSMPIAPLVQRLYACDINRQLIEVAAQSNVFTNVKFHTLQHNTDLDFIPDNSLDAVFTYGVLCHLEDDEIGQLLQSFLQKLTPQGRILLFELCENGAETFKTALLLRRSAGHWHQLLHADKLYLSRHIKLLRLPSYARHLWNKYRFLPHSLLPLMRLIERLTLHIKPQHIEYTIDLFELKGK
jgi:2-polyprenyl-3-methyl-5-hydroxy-6-metoxy-1,4-benzoquinol methylase